MENYSLYNVTGNMEHAPGYICNIQAKGMESAFEKSKHKLSLGIKKELGLDGRTKISFTKLYDEIESRDNRGVAVGYTTCSITNTEGFVIDSYDYMIVRE